ncbi:hypothetical protein Poli38472_001006 [Pythium oligandrum]|uniref:Uncharacterized protein n=1 Tax=Pythium oligandrum TaxID=41045 RepID=A0A8K1CDC1_PYTOL|nr:hypothetical protein Poli38472_001006 [Pythium oligandrum]|eukprot:TMW60964.1 hypothetical protein Poli38472_001006 [Pythium oligandrum]
MEAVAAFVYASGGLVQVGEVKQFLHDDPEVERVFYEEVAPLKVLKKIITHHGEAHGLQWMDEDPEGRERGNFVVHVPTPQQLVTLVDVTRWVPRSLAALETHLNGLEMQRMKYGAASIFYQDYEPEWSFIRRRCGSVHNFVCRYDPLQSRFVSSPVEVRLVEAQTLAGTALTHGEEGDADDSDEVLTHLEDQSEVALGTEVVPDSPKLGQFELTATGGDGLEVGKKRITLKRWLRYKTMDALRAVQGVIRNVSSLTVHRPIISSWAIVRQSKGATTAKKRSLRARQETRSVPERPVWATTKSNEDGHEAIQTSNPSDSLVVEASSLDDEELEKPLKLGVMRLLIPEAGPNGCSSLEWKTKVRVIRTTHP